MSRTPSSYGEGEGTDALASEVARSHMAGTADASSTSCEFVGVVNNAQATEAQVAWSGPTVSPALVQNVLPVTSPVAIPMLSLDFLLHQQLIQSQQEKAQLMEDMARSRQECHQLKQEVEDLRNSLNESQNSQHTKKPRKLSKKERDKLRQRKAAQFPDCDPDYAGDPRPDVEESTQASEIEDHASMDSYGAVPTQSSQASTAIPLCGLEQIVEGQSQDVTPIRAPLRSDPQQPGEDESAQSSERQEDAFRGTLLAGPDHGQTCSSPSPSNPQQPDAAPGSTRSVGSTQEWQRMAEDVIATENTRELLSKTDANHLVLAAARGACLDAGRNVSSQAGSQNPVDSGQVTVEGYLSYVPFNTIISLLEALWSGKYSDEYVRDAEYMGEDAASLLWLRKVLHDMGFGLVDDVIHFISRHMGKFMLAMKDGIHKVLGNGPVLNGACQATAFALGIRLIWDLSKYLLGYRSFYEMFSRESALSYMVTVAICISANALTAALKLKLAPAIAVTIAISYMVHKAIHWLDDPVSNLSRALNRAYEATTCGRPNSWADSDIAIPEAMKCPLTNRLLFDPLVVNGEIYERYAIISLIQMTGRDRREKPPRLHLLRPSPEMKELCAFFAREHDIQAIHE